MISYFFRQVSEHIFSGGVPASPFYVPVENYRVQLETMETRTLLLD